MKLSSDDPRKSGQRPRRGRVAAALGLCALAAGTQAFIPTSAPAMTNSELAQICSAATELGSPIRCVTDTNTGSGSGSGTTYGAKETGRGVIEIVAPKPLEPAYYECGFGDIQATRRADCDIFKKRGTHRIDVSDGNRSQAQNVQASIGAPGPEPGRVKQCVLARASWADAKEARDSLDAFRKKLKPDGSFPDLKTSIDFELAWIGWTNEYPEKFWRAGFGTNRPGDVRGRWSDRQFIEKVARVLNFALETRKEAEKQACDPATLKAKPPPRRP